MADTRTTLARQLDTVTGHVDTLETVLASQSGFAAAAAKTATAAANTAVAVTLAAPGAGNRHAIAAVHYSYSAAPTGGKLTIASPSGTTVFDIDITAAGPGVVVFDPPLVVGANAAAIVTLAAGSGSVVGKATVHAGVVTSTPL